MTQENLQERARRCNECLCWLDVCQSECCKVFLVHNAMFEKVRNHYVIDARIFDDEEMKNYYRLRGCGVSLGRVIAPAKDFRLVEKGSFTEFWKECSELSPEGLCKVHGTSRQPDICRRFLPCDKRTTKGVYITPRCLAAYKEGIDDEEQEQ